MRNKTLTVCAICAVASCVPTACTSADANQTNTDESRIEVTTNQEEEPEAETIEKSQPQDLPLGVLALKEGFPGIIVDYDDNKIVFADGSTLPYDDGKEKDFATRLDNCDIEDMFFTKYVLPDDAPEYLADAGRARSEALYKKVYGATPEAVAKNLTTVDWFGQKVKFTKVNGAAEQLKKVAAELAQYPELKKYLKSSGTYYWRQVRGANRLSAHSYGIAFDIGVDHSNYWQWQNPKAKETDKIKYTNRIPRKIVEIFQKHGFIWGGAWYHFDTMHFEYRPEILAYGRK